MADRKYQNIEDFEKKLTRTCRFAVAGVVFHKVTKWLGRGAIGWATVVLMGGFASQLEISSFITITRLVLIIFFLLPFALLTCNLVTKKSLSTGSIHPLRLRYQDGRLRSVNWIIRISIFLQCLFFIWACITSALQIHRSDWRFLFIFFGFGKPHNAATSPELQACLQSCATNYVHKISAAPDLITCSLTANLKACLFTFHFLVVATCVMALLCNLYIFFTRIVLFGNPKSLSLTRYHDEVLSRGLSTGLVEADEFNWRDYLLRCVGEDLVIRNIAPLGVHNQNKDFIEYLFYYPKGVEMIMGMLASQDTLLQQTAANMPGFWSSEHMDMERDGMQLLSRLGEKLGMPGKVAEGAANSFKALAVVWKEREESPLLKVYVSKSSGSTNAASRSVEGVAGGGESTNAISRSGGGDGSRSANESAGGSGESVNASDNVVQDGTVRSRGGGGSGGGGGGGDELKWNVVQKVVDLVANKRVPTLQVYVRTLDGFFMSESVKNSLTTEETEQIRNKLLRIVRGERRVPRATAEHTGVAVEDSHKARTRLLAFSALDRLVSDPPPDEFTVLLQTLDRVLGNVAEDSVIWIDEVNRYIELCDKHSDRRGDWLSSGKWVVKQLEG